MFIDGQWTHGESSQAIEVENPANEETIATIPAGTAGDARRALEAAKRALPKWAELPPIERAKLLHKLADAVVADRDRLARIVTLEQGKPLKEAIGEIGATETFIRYAAESARRIEGDIMPSDNPREEVWIRRVPYKIESIVNEAIRASANVLLGGRRLRGGRFAKGHWFEPTVLAGLDNEAPIFQKEVFGPVIPVLRFRDFDEAIRYANQTEYGLSAFVFTNDFRRIMKLSRTLQFGEVYVNRPNGELIQGFHNGWRNSGRGGEDGKYGLDGYFRKQTTYLNFA